MAVLFIENNKVLFSGIFGGTDERKVELLRGDVIIQYAESTVSMWKGQLQLLNAASYSAIELFGNGAFESMQALKDFFAAWLLGTGNHWEIVSATVRSTEWHEFEYAPCSSLTVVNNAAVDLRWHIGNPERYMIVKKDEQVTIGGIGNANQVNVQPDVETSETVVNAVLVL